MSATTHRHGILVIMFLGVMIISHFYSPWDEYSIIGQIEMPSDTITEIVAGILVKIIMFGITDYWDMVTVVIRFMNGSSIVSWLCPIVVIVPFFLTSIMLEKWHAEIKNGCDPFMGVCVDMYCLENITGYLCSFLSYKIVKWILQSEKLKDSYFVGVIAAIAIGVASWFSLIALCYIMAHILTLVLPVILGMIVKDIPGIGEFFSNSTVVIILMVCSAVFLWHIISGYVFEKCIQLLKLPLRIIGIDG